MPLPPGFIEAIRSAPADDLPRLAAADWLDEHGDPARAELIRVQCEIEQAIGTPADEQAAFDAHMLRRAVDHNTPPAADDPPILQLLRREAELLKRGTPHWFADAARMADDTSIEFRYQVRRGFADAAGMRTSEFLARRADVRAACQPLTELTLFGPRGHGPALAAVPELAGVRRVELAGWLTPADADALARSPHLRGCESLVVWAGDRDQGEVAVALAAGPALGGLRELVLVQLYGGPSVGDWAGELDRAADGLAAAWNAVRGTPVVRVDRPFARRFPLNGDVGYGVYAGHLPGGRPVVVTAGRQPVFIHIGPDGRPTAEERPDWSGLLVEPPQWSWLDYRESEFERLLAERAGFERGVVFVREFASAAAELSVQWLGVEEDAVAAPDGADEDACSSLAWWRRSGNFVVLHWNDYWAGPAGTIHTS